MLTGSLVETLLKAVDAKDDIFVRELLNNDTYNQNDMTNIVKLMSESTLLTFLQVLVGTVIQNPYSPECLSWLLITLTQLDTESKESSQKAALLAVDSVLDNLRSVRDQCKELNTLVKATLDAAISSVQNHSVKRARRELTRASRDVEPLVSFKL
ncbi:hypothetical protein GNI_062230 [Gregarina niphandrodes]|uniref:Uncharacterized protein n=1 Tax=Gregarina niphandrodes TaxID=110365 RepID=A0A023B8A4_GRENI|nr:hypothetical protein GNI_062230 [Gregarina niphandrodes]EZG68472.1 hypothetical protein GNI_062230 [Gregarina niphandrodes]|eukprot:XP_011134577.1 hypothetical protein GNI_062230 [Gregarina niphandrodes]